MGNQMTLYKQITSNKINTEIYQSLILRFHSDDLSIQQDRDDDYKEEIILSKNQALKLAEEILLFYRKEPNETSNS